MLGEVCPAEGADLMHLAAHVPAHEAVPRMQAAPFAVPCTVLTALGCDFLAVDDVNNCMGRRSNSSANPLRGPVPKSCEAAVQRLQDCLEEQQRLQVLAEAAQRQS